jgi:hypothetical protein
VIADTSFGCLGSGNCQTVIYEPDPNATPILLTYGSRRIEYDNGCSGGGPVGSALAIPARVAVDLASEIELPLHLEEVQSPAQAAANTIGEIEDVLATAPSQSTRSLENAIDSLENAVVALSMTPLDTQTATLNLDAANRELEMAANKGLPTATSIALMDDVVGVSRLLATDAIAIATAGSGSPLKISQAQTLLAQGDTLRSSAKGGSIRDFRPAGRKYGDSTARAESAL